MLVEHYTGDRRVAISRFTAGGVTVLCPWTRHFICCLYISVGSTQEDRPDMTEIFLTGTKRSKPKNKNKAPSNNSDCPGHPTSLISVLAQHNDKSMDPWLATIWIHRKGNEQTGWIMPRLIRTLLGNASNCCYGHTANCCAYAYHSQLQQTPIITFLEVFFLSSADFVERLSFWKVSLRKYHQKVN